MINTIGSAERIKALTSQCEEIELVLSSASLEAPEVDSRVKTDREAFLALKGEINTEEFAREMKFMQRRAPTAMGAWTFQCHQSEKNLSNYAIQKEICEKQKKIDQEMYNIAKNIADDPLPTYTKESLTARFSTIMEQINSVSQEISEHRAVHSSSDQDAYQEQQLRLNGFLEAMYGFAIDIKTEDNLKAFLESVSNTDDYIGNMLTQIDESCKDDKEHQESAKYMLRESSQYSRLIQLKRLSEKAYVFYKKENEALNQESRNGHLTQMLSNFDQITEKKTETITMLETEKASKTTRSEQVQQEIDTLKESLSKQRANEKEHVQNHKQALQKVEETKGTQNQALDSKIAANENVEKLRKKLSDIQKHLDNLKEEMPQRNERKVQPEAETRGVVEGVEAAEANVQQRNEMYRKAKAEMERNRNALELANKRINQIPEEVSATRR